MKYLIQHPEGGKIPLHLHGAGHKGLLKIGFPAHNIIQNLLLQTDFHIRSAALLGKDRQTGRLNMKLEHRGIAAGNMQGKNPSLSGSGRKSPLP